MREAKGQHRRAVGTVGALLWELFEVLWDYFDEPIFAFSKTHSLSWLGLLNRIGTFALVSLLLVL